LGCAAARCSCPALFDGPTCARPYVTAYITLQGTNNLDDAHMAGFVAMVTNDITESLGTNTNYFRVYQPVEHSSTSAKVELRFYDQQPDSNPSPLESGVILRDRFVAVVNDPNSHFHVQTVSGAVTGTNAPIANPDQSIPDQYHGSSGDNKKLALEIALPIGLGLLFILVCAYIINKFCCNKSGGGGGRATGQEMTDTSGQAARS